MKMINIPDDKWRDMLLQAKAIEEIAIHREQIDTSTIDALVPSEVSKDGLTDELFYQAAFEWGISLDTAQKVMDMYKPSFERMLEQMSENGIAYCVFCGKGYKSIKVEVEQY